MITHKYKDGMFTLKPAGLYHTDAKQKTIRLSAFFEILYQDNRQRFGETIGVGAWFRVIEWKDPSGKTITRTIQVESLHRSPHACISKLAADGLEISPDKYAKQLLIAYLLDYPCKTGGAL